MTTRHVPEYAAFASHAWTEDNGRDNHSLVVKVCTALEGQHGVKVWLDANDMGAGSITEQMSRGIQSSEVAIVLLSQRYIDGVNGNWPAGKEFDNCQREYDEIIKSKGYLRVVPVLLDATLRDQKKWGKKIKKDLEDLFYYDASMLFESDGDTFVAKVAELANAIEQARVGEVKMKQYAIRRALHTDKELQLPDAMAGAKLHGIEPVQRDWVLKVIKDWYAQRKWSRAFVMLGDAGMGKSVLAAMLTLHGGTVLDNVPRRVSLRNLVTRFSRRGSHKQTGFTVGAAHFFSYADQNTSDMRLVIYSIANQLCGVVPGLLQQLFDGPGTDALANIKDMAVLFRAVVAEPCRKVSAPPAGRVVVIFDALDECLVDARRQLLGILQTDFLRECPDWLGFLATSRKDDFTPMVLQDFHPTVLDAEQHKNEDDLRIYFNRRLRSSGLVGTELERATDVLTSRSQGLFLYARFANDGLDRLQRANNVTLAAIEDERNFASGMSAVYAQYFERFKATALGGSDALYKQVLGSLLVARGPLPLGLLDLGDLDVEDFAEAARNLFIVGDDGSLRFVHKSMADWVSGSDKSNPRRDLIVKPAVGQKQLAELCFKQQAHPFALRHALHHLCSSGRVPDAAALLLDVSWLLTALQDDGVDPVDLVLDADPFLDKPGEPAGDVLRVLEKGANALRHDPREVASQLYARLDKPHLALDSVDSSFTGRWLKPIKPSLEPAQSPLRKTLVGHQKAVFSVAYCHELDMIVSGSDDKAVNLWRASTGELLRTLEGHSDFVTGVAVSAELDMVVSGSWDKTVKVWKTSTGQLLRTLEGHSSYVRSVAVTAKLDMIVSGSDDKTIKVWKASTGQLLRTLEGHSHGLRSVAVSAELDLIVSASNDKTVKLWKASTGQLMRTLEGHSDSVRSVAISAELDMIVSGSQDKTVKVWKASTGKLLRTLDGHSEEVNAVAVSAELDMIVSGSQDTTITLWKASTGQVLRTLEGHSDEVRSVAVSAELNIVVSGSDDKTAKMWKVSSGQLVRTPEGHSSWVRSVAVLAELGLILTGSRDKTVKVWKASTGQLLRTLNGHSNDVTSVAGSVELDIIVSGSDDKTARVWKASTGQLLHTLEGHAYEVRTVAVSAELDMIVSGSDDRMVMVWKASTGQLLHTLEGNSWGITSVAVSTDMITSRDVSGKKLFWDVRTLEPMQPSKLQESQTVPDPVDVQGGYHVSIPGTKVAGFSTDADVWEVARADDIVVIGDVAGMVHVLHM